MNNNMFESITVDEMREIDGGGLDWLKGFNAIVTFFNNIVDGAKAFGEGFSEGANEWHRPYH